MTALHSLALATITGVAIAAAAFPVAAEDVSANYKGSPACAKLTESARRMACEMDESVKRTKEYDRRSDEADQRAACSQFIIEGVKSSLFTKEQVVAAYGGTVTKEIVQQRGCDVARSLGFGRRASLDEAKPQ